MKIMNQTNETEYYISDINIYDSNNIDEIRELSDAPTLLVYLILFVSVYINMVFERRE